MSRVVQDPYSISDVDEAVLREFVDDRIHNIHTAQPAEVIAIDGSNTFNGRDRTVAIRLGVRRDIRGKSKKIAPILYVPIVYPAGKKFGMTWPLEVGDTGLAVFSETSIDHWWLDEGGESVNPRDIRMHDYTDAFFIPHVLQRSKANECPDIEDDSLCIYSGSGQDVKIKLKDNGTFCIETKSGEFLKVLTDALSQISVASGGAGAGEITKLLSMRCESPI